MVLSLELGQARYPLRGHDSSGVDTTPEMKSSLKDMSHTGLHVSFFMRPSLAPDVDDCWVSLGREGRSSHRASEGDSAAQKAEVGDNVYEKDLRNSDVQHYSAFKSGVSRWSCLL